MSMIDQLREAVGTGDYVNDDVESSININYSDGTTDTITINGGINQYGSLTSAQISTLSPCYTVGIGTMSGTGGYTCIPSLTIGNICHGTTTWATGSGGGGGC